MNSMVVSIKQIISDIAWDDPLKHIVGDDYCLNGISVFYDFNWEKVFGHKYGKFPGGLRLARLVTNKCPESKTPALILTSKENVAEASRETKTHYFVIVKISSYLHSLQDNTAATYFALRQLGNNVIPKPHTSLIEVSQDIESNIKEITKLITKLDIDNIEIDDAVMKPLVDFIREHYDSLIDENKAFLPLDKPFCKDNAEQLKKIFSLQKKKKLISFIVKNKIIPSDIELGLIQSRKKKAVNKFRRLLKKDKLEKVWQRWFERNSWVLGSDFVRVVDERYIDPKNIADFLVEAYDGFLDIIEIKRPGGSLKFWAKKKDHQNYIPHTELIKAITQATIYIHEVEQEANSKKFSKSVDNISVIKPRCTLVYGRSNTWNKDQFEAYRILNSSYHNITILTYDLVLERAIRILEM